ncbi:MAG: alpha/beta hydrolase [Salinivirgaceae bacterium]|nr:alpha/beta hydrolase [Salinivirgaceae bacterium]
MRLTNLILLWFVSLFFCPCFAQVYNPESQKVVAIGKSGQVEWNKGVFNGIDAQYGTLVACEMRQAKNSKLISIPVVRTQSLDFDCGVPVFILGGGPGETNISTNLFFDTLAYHHQLVMVGYRGVDGTTKLSCPDMISVFNSTDISIDNFALKVAQAYNNQQKQWQSNQINVSGYTIDEVVQDIEDVRRNIGAERICVVAFSYGAMIAQRYNELFPNKLAANVLIAPRKLNDFCISENEIENIGLRIAKSEFNATKVNPLKYLQSKVDDAEKQGFNRVRFLLYIFSKLYTYNDMNQLVDFCNQIENGDWNSIKVDYSKFCSVYSKNILLGDVVAKRYLSQNAVSSSCCEMLNVVNTWFSPVGLGAITANKTFNFNCPSLIIEGDFDAVSQLSETEHSDLNKRGFQFKKLTKTGHSDLIGFRKDEIAQIIFEFFNSIKL